MIWKEESRGWSNPFNSDTGVLISSTFAIGSSSTLRIGSIAETEGTIGSELELYDALDMQCDLLNALDAQRELLLKIGDIVELSNVCVFFTFPSQVLFVAA